MICSIFFIEFIHFNDKSLFSCTLAFFQQKFKIMFKQLLFIAFLLSALQSYSQNNSAKNSIRGELLLQLKTKTTIEKIRKDSGNLSITKIETISNRFHIYLLHYDEKAMSAQSLKKILKSKKGVLNIQDNHRISLRSIDNDTLPNDTFFNKQWALYNNGSGGGVAGADIDATEAWDITTGGLTALGDTIVVAIIDGGTDLNHEDLDFWKNRAEIPNNGIDDDDNGYIDDYDGWNAYNHTGNIPLFNHGVHVCGIAGAIGNNNIGISGVNWTVKILPIAGSSTTESTVVEALSYLYVVRETYNETGGEQGAFVVADNCSFGVDKGNPANYPIWEAMYDSLGQLGVLSNAATANRDWDIDSVGDVPTAFTTDYMISVTNTDKRDHLYSSAGYGLTTIDLGAPGTNIYSLRINNGYGYSTGTSMATPQVTGAVALIISAADSTFIANFKNSPAEGALLIKNFILKGVDTLPDLMGKTVSGGRLNVFNAINLLLNAPVIVTDIDSLFAKAPLNTPVEESFLLSNTGNDSLFYKITIANQPSWISLASDTGVLANQQYTTINVAFDDAGLDTGYYYCSMKIKGTDAFSKTIPVIFFVYTNVGINSLHQRKTIVKIYPNPFSSAVDFSINSTASGLYEIKIYDQYGKLMTERTKNLFAGTNNEIITTRNLPSGVYYYRIMTAGKFLKTGKLVKL